jgi:hypothetical protein
MSAAYIVPTDLLGISPPQFSEWHATTIPADPTQSLVLVSWNNPNAEMFFESQPGVLFLGEPWETLSAEASPLLASFQDSPTTGAIAAPTTDPSVTDSVATALRKIPWPGARMLR